MCALLLDRAWTRRGFGLLPAVLAFASAGCLTTTQVRVRDPTRVGVHVQRGDAFAEVLAPGKAPRTAVATEGQYWWFLSKLHYQVHAVRETSGALALRCEECGVARWPLRGQREVLLVGPEGNLTPSFGRPTLTRETLVVPYDLCFVDVRRHRHRFCRVMTHTRIAIPWTNVAEARRRVKPVRWAGAWLTAMGAAFLGAGALAVSPALDGLSKGWRAAIAVPSFTVGAAFAGAGIWILAAPVREEVLLPAR